MENKISLSGEMKFYFPSLRDHNAFIFKRDFAVYASGVKEKLRNNTRLTDLRGAFQISQTDREQLYSMTLT